MTLNAESVRMNSDERRRLADRIERHVWLVVKPATRDDIDLGQLRVNILDAVEAALWGARNDGPGEPESYWERATKTTRIDGRACDA